MHAEARREERRARAARNAKARPYVTRLVLFLVAFTIGQLAAGALDCVARRPPVPAAARSSAR